MTKQESRERRITITLSKKQKAFLLDFAEKRGLTPSKLVAWLLYYKTKEFKNILELNENPKKAIKRAEIDQFNEDEDQNLTDEEFKAKYNIK